MARMDAPDHPVPASRLGQAPAVITDTELPDEPVEEPEPDMPESPDDEPVEVPQ